MMFSKYATLLAFATTAIAGAIEPGVYRISNVASHSTARSYIAYSHVYVSSTKEYVGPFELVSAGSESLFFFALEYTLFISFILQWDIQDSEDGSYTLQNVGLGSYAAVTVGP